MRRPLPALISGTSSEYLGNRPLRRILRERPVVVIQGPPQSGKSSVAVRVATWPGNVQAVRIGARELQEGAERWVMHRAWPDRIARTPSLIVDGCELLRRRDGVRRALLALLAARSAAGLRTVLVDLREDGSSDALMSHLPAGSAALLALRFPKGTPGRLRWARRMCDDLGLPRTYAAGTDQMEPWTYEGVLSWLRDQVVVAASS